MKINVKTGIDVLISTLINDQPTWLENKRLGLLINSASLNKQLRASADLIYHHFPDQLKALFTPQHGYYAAKQDNMIESDDLVHQQYNIPIYSLYGKTRVPMPHMLEDIDTLIVDLQDVGTRVYTFIYTLSYCMEAAKKHGKTVVILDRTNPISGTSIEGNCLTPEFRSFVGRYAIPMRHGLTIAEFARYINETENIHCDLAVVPMTGWKRNLYFDDTDLTWIAPSPNMPSANTAIVYPGQVIFEGTNISEGRGTTQPFEIIGTPFIDTQKILNRIGDIPGVYLRPLCFEPTFHKWHNQLCHGFQIHVTDRALYNSYVCSLKILQAIILEHPKEFSWKLPPYEYEYRKKPIDLIIGSQTIRERIENGVEIDTLQQDWMELTEKFHEQCKPFLLYE